MKKLITTIISLMFFGNLVFAQLTEFSMGDILSAGAMNQNFKYLENRFGGIQRNHGQLWYIRNWKWYQFCDSEWIQLHRHQRNLQGKHYL